MNQPLTGRDKIDLIEKIKQQIKDNQITAKQLFPDNPLVIWTVDDVEQVFLSFGADVPNAEILQELLEESRTELENTEYSWEPIEAIVQNYLENKK